MYLACGRHSTMFFTLGAVTGVRGGIGFYCSVDAHDNRNFCESGLGLNQTLLGSFHTFTFYFGEMGFNQGNERQRQLMRGIK